MSGGTFDYENWRIRDVQLHVSHLLKPTCEDEECPMSGDCSQEDHDSLQKASETSRVAVDLTAQILYHVNILVDSLDKWIAGDTGEEEFLSDFTVLLDELRSIVDG